MTNEELLTAIREGGEGNRDKNDLLMELWNQNSGMIWKACGKYRKRIEEEDARQECFFALLEAVKEYDPEMGSTFANYLFRRCTWHLSRYAADYGQIIRLPEYRRQQIKAYLQIVRLWYQRSGTEPNQWILDVYLGLSAEDIEQIKEDMRVLNLRSIDEPLTDDPEGGTLSDLVEDEGTDTEAAGIDPVFIQERKRAIWKAVDSLKPAESEAIRLYYQHGLTYDQAAMVSGKTRQAIRGIIAAGIRKLRFNKRYKELRSFADLSIEYSKGIQGTGSGTFNRTFTSATEKTALWIMESEERFKRQREELEQMLEDSRRDREEYERRKAAREAGRT